MPLIISMKSNMIKKNSFKNIQNNNNNDLSTNM